MLGFLNSKNKYHRILRRGVIIGGLTFLAVLINEYMLMAPEAIVPLLAAIGAMIDKFTRETKGK